MKIKIPENLSEITIEQYQKFDLVEGEDTFKSLKMIELFCNVPLKIVARMSVKDVDETLKLLTSAFDKKRKFTQRFTLDGIEYGFIPDLENITMGEYIDLDTYIGNIDDLHRLMSVLYRPIELKNKELYTIEKYEVSEALEQAMKKAPLDIALEAQVFFYNLGKELLNALNHYLVDQAMNLQQKQTLRANGDGIRQFMQSQTGIFSNLTKQQNKDYTNA